MSDFCNTNDHGGHLNRSPAPILPLEILGDRWARWTEEAARAANAPVDYVVAPLLAAASSVIGHARWAQAWEGWAEPPHLWCASVGRCGDGKSSGTDAICGYILPTIEQRMAADFRCELRQAQAEIKIAKARLDAWKRELRTAVREGRPAPPSPGPVPELRMAPRLTASTITIARLALLLSTAAPKGLLVTDNELAGWLLGLNAYDDAARAFWLEAYSGRRYWIDHLTSDAIAIPRFAVSFHSGIHSGNLAEVMHDVEDGFLARFMWFWPDPVPFVISRSEVKDWAITAFDKLRMLDLLPGDDGPRPVMVTLDDAAAEHLIGFAQLMQERKEASTGLLRSAIRKSRGHVLRLSLVLEHLHWCTKEETTQSPSKISGDTMLAAIRFVSEYALPMAERTFSAARFRKAHRPHQDAALSTT
jgi:Protein of unknown function (DUF3987)